MNWYSKIAATPVPEKAVHDPEGLLALSPEERQQRIEQDRQRRIEQFKSRRQQPAPVAPVQVQPSRPAFQPRHR